MHTANLAICTQSTWFLEITYPPPLPRIKCFQLITFTPSFYMFRHKAGTFPSWSFFMMPVPACCDKDRRHSKCGWSILRGEMSCLFMRKPKHFLCISQTFFPFSFVAAVVNQPTEEHTGSAHDGAFHLFTDHSSFCAMQLAVLWGREHPLPWIITDSIPSLLSTDLHKAELFQFDYHEEHQHQCITGKLRVPLRWLCFTKITTWQSASLRWKRKHKSWRARDAEL